MRLFLVIFVLSASLFAYKPIEEIEYDEDLAKIGKYLYFDVNLSPDKISCNSCHDLTLTGSGTMNSGVNTDGLPNPPTVLNIGHNSLFFIDGSIYSLYEQVKATLEKDMNVTPKNFDVIAKSNEKYEKLFNKIGKKFTYDNLVAALGEFEKALVTLDSPFDRFLQGEENAISEAAERGLDLFKKYGCNSCHNGDNFGSNIVAEINHSFSSLCAENSSGFVQVPTLRNIAITAPYTYKGAFFDLHDIIRAMSACQLGIVMPDQDVEDLVEFLNTLTGKKPKILEEE